MRRKNERFTDYADRVLKDIKRQTRRRFSAEEKIRIVLPDRQLRSKCREGRRDCPEPALLVVQREHGSK